MSTDLVRDRLAVVGAGVMGTGIAAMVAGHGTPVVLIDVDSGTLDRALTSVAHQLRHGQLLGSFPESIEPGSVTASTSIDAAAAATSVIEAVTEDAAVKAKVLAEISAVVSPGTPLITNTSGIPIDELARAVARPTQLLGAHFMNPTYLITMVEVVRGGHTDDATLASVIGVLDRLRRKVVVVRDAPGFVTSRLLHPMINEAARIVAAGTATVEAVDDLMQGCLGHPTGPLRTADLIGLDNLADALQVLAERTGNETYRPCELLLSKVRDGDLGRKTGRGFYDYGKVLW